MTIERLEHAAALVPDPELSAWLSSAAHKIAHGLPADQALDLAGCGAIRERDRLIRQAAAVLALPTRWQTAGELSQRIRHAPRHRDVIDDLLDHARRCARLPRGQRQIYNILTANEPTRAAIPERDLAA
jgi:hypothetical protein